MVAGVSGSSFTESRFLRPIPSTVTRCEAGQPASPRTSLTLMAAIESPSFLALGALELGQVLAAHAGGLLGRTQALQAVDRRLEDVVGVARALALGEHVADPGRLEHGAHGAAGDDAGSLPGRLEQHPARAEVSQDLVGDGGAGHGNLEEALLGLLASLADGLGDLVGLAEADSDVALSVA